MKGKVYLGRERTDRVGPSKSQPKVRHVTNESLDEGHKKEVGSTGE